MKQKNLIVSVPILEPYRPPISVAIIAHAIEIAGYPVSAIDLNVKFYNFLGNEKYHQMEPVWEGKRPIELHEFKTVITFLNGYKKQFADQHSIMISVFGTYATTFTKILCKYIRKHCKTCKIVLGGQGVLTADIGKTNANDNFGTDGDCDCFLRLFYLEDEWR